MTVIANPTAGLTSSAGKNVRQPTSRQRWSNQSPWHRWSPLLGWGVRLRQALDLSTRASQVPSTCTHLTRSDLKIIKVDDRRDAIAGILDDCYFFVASSTHGEP